MEQEELKKIAKTSGNALHFRIANYFRGKGWTVLISPYYLDNISDKPREIDLVAEKLFSIKGYFGQDAAMVKIKLFIECKYIANPTVIWFDEKDFEKAEERIIKTTPLPKENIYTKKHHYYTVPEVAKLSSGKNDIIYDSVNQVLNGFISLKDQNVISPDEYVPIKAVLNYPIVICNSFDTLGKIIANDLEDIKPIEDNFQLETNYVYRANGASIKEYFLVDFVSEKLIDAFVDSTLRDDLKQVGMILR